MKSCRIESAYNDVLNGTDGREYGYFAGKSSVEGTVKARRMEIPLSLRSM